MRGEAYPVFGTDTVSSAYFRNWYQTTDLGHYLDNSNPYTVYESETTGEWNLGDRNVFSIAGNSFKNTKYLLNGMRIDGTPRMADDNHLGIAVGDDCFQDIVTRRLFLKVNPTGRIGVFAPDVK